MMEISIRKAEIVLGKVLSGLEFLQKFAELFSFLTNVYICQHNNKFTT